MGIGGEVADPKTLGPGSREAHFAVRAEVENARVCVCVIFIRLTRLFLHASVYVHLFMFVYVMCTLQDRLMPLVL